MTLTEKQNILEVLNSLDVIEENGGDEAYILVENNEENHKLLNEVGISSETINKYGDEETFCVLALAFSEGYCDMYDGGKLIAFEDSVEVGVGDGKSVLLYKHENSILLSIFEDSGNALWAELTAEQVNQIRKVIEKE